MIVIKNVLVATDFSAPAACALAYGRELARTYNATLHALHAVDDLGCRYAIESLPAVMVGLQQELEENGRQRLQALLDDEDRQQLRAVAVTVTSLAPADTIVEYASAANIDVIVLGTHGRRGVSRALMGSVAERVVRMAPCPVLTVHEHERTFLAPDALSVAAGKAFT